MLVVFFFLLLVTLFPPNGPSASFPCTLASIGFSLWLAHENVVRSNRHKMLCRIEIDQKFLLSLKKGEGSWAQNSYQFTHESTELKEEIDVPEH